MAGPGGGPSRRSHTKSRKGCKTCKRRHIRCDETFPQCRNCTKHQVRCDYMDGPQAAGGGGGGGDESSGAHQPGLLWTPEVETAIDLWQQTGNFPFPELQLYPQPQWSTLSRVDLRLIHNVAQMCSESARDGTSKVIVWADLMPKFLSAAASHPFVMHAVLSFSANHLAWASQSDETRDIAMHHRANALRGLHEAIGTFSQANADAVLAASLLLAWQATDWRNWASLMTGISSITRAMQSWRDQSAFRDYLTEHASDPARTYTDTSEFQQTPERDRERALALQNLSAALDRLQANLPDNEQGIRWIEQLRNYVRRLHTSTAPLTPEEQFSQLYALRKWLFWVPVSLLTAQRHEILTLLVLAHFYAAALAVEPVFPDLGADFVANHALASLTEIVRIVAQFQQSQGYSAGAQQVAALMQFPSDMASSYRSRRDWTRQSMAIPTVQQPPYGLDALNLDLTAQLSDQSYYHSLSPAFAPSPLHLASPAIMATQGGAPRSPYLEVPGTPHTAVSVTTAGYLQGMNLYSAPVSAPMASPLHSPSAFGNYAPPPQQQQQQEQVYMGSMGSMGSTWHGGPTPHLLQQQQQQQQQQPPQPQNQQTFHQPPIATAILKSNTESAGVESRGKATESSVWMPPRSTG